MPTVLIAGCGYVGEATADLLHGRGWSVEGWTHSTESAAALRGKPYPVRAVDISDPAQVADAAGEFDVVIHCASSGGGGAEIYRQVYLQGARNLLDVLAPARFIWTSSTSVYAQTDGSWVTEESVAEPTRETGKILRETEAVVLASGGIVARLAGIYGPGRAALLRKFLAGEAVLETGGERFLNQIHRDDVAAALLLFAEARAPSGIYNVADDEPWTQRACYEWLAARLDRPLPPAGAPAPNPKRGVTNKRVSNAKLRALGWAPQFRNFAEAMARSILPAAGMEAAEPIRHASR